MPLFDRLKTFFSSRGRADRKEYWAWVAGAVASLALVATLATLFGDNGVYDTPDIPRAIRLALLAPAFVLLFVMAIKMRGVTGRRRNDAEVSDGFRRVRSVPILGRYLDFFTLGFLPSVKGSNEHGPGPGTPAIVDMFGDKPPR